MKQPKTISVLYRAVAGLSVEQQREACEAAAKRLGLRIAHEYSADDDATALRDWRRGTTSTNIAMVAALICIPAWQAGGQKPGPVLHEVLLDFATRVPPLVLVEALSGVSSADGPKWLKITRAAMDALSLGARKRSRKEYQRMARKSHEGRRPAAAKWFAALPQTARDAISRIWRDPKFASAKEAHAAMPDDVRDIIRSVETAYRVLNERRPGDKRAGGRGRKVARKKLKR